MTSLNAMPVTAARNAVAAVNFGAAFAVVNPGAGSMFVTNGDGGTTVITAADGGTKI